MNERILKNLVNGNTIVVVSDSNKINLVTYADFCFFVERKRIYKFEYVNRELIFPNGGKVIFVEKQRIDNIKGLEIQD